MRFSSLKGAGRLAAFLFVSTTFTNGALFPHFVHCTPAQQQMLTNAWDDAMALAGVAHGVMTAKTNEALVQKYFFEITREDRAMVETAYLNAATSGTISNQFVLSCGDFQANDMSSTGVPVPATATVCRDPLTNAYTRKVYFLGDVVGASTNDIAACAMLNTDRIGRVTSIWSSPAQYTAFCAETDIPGLVPANIGMTRRTYFRGWTFLHEMMHTQSVGGHIISQGPGDMLPFPGAADFTYDQAVSGLLEPA